MSIIITTSTLLQLPAPHHPSFPRQLSHYSCYYYHHHRAISGSDPLFNCPRPGQQRPLNDEGWIVTTPAAAPREDDLTTTSVQLSPIPLNCPLTCIVTACIALHDGRRPVDLLRLGGWLEDVAVLGDHQHGDEVDDGQRKELGLLRLLLKHPFLINKICVLKSNNWQSVMSGAGHRAEE